MSEQFEKGEQLDLSLGADSTTHDNIEDENFEIVEEERALLEQVRAALDEMPESKAASQAPLVRELERLRETMISGDEAKDQSALLEQYHHQSAVLDQLQKAGEPEK
ncbi:MAG: hypothetical protein ACJAYI_001017, partial [Myxococcota bacterium]